MSNRWCNQCGYVESTSSSYCPKCGKDLRPNYVSISTPSAHCSEIELLKSQLAAMTEQALKACKDVATLKKENERLKAELRDITLTLNDDRTHNTLTIAQVCASIKDELIKSQETIRGLVAIAKSYEQQRDKARDNFIIRRPTLDENSDYE